MATNEIVPAEYRYFLVDILTNQTIAEIPFVDVSYERALSKAGSFSGSIPVIDATVALDLYENTMPGKTSVFVLRNGVCVWGGIIWGRQYSPSGKKLTVDASEFISYLYHRVLWQTLYYGSENVFCSKYQAASGTATVFTAVEHGFVAGDIVRIKNLNAALNGDRTVLATPSLASFTFSSPATLALSPSNTGVARSVLDSYETTRQLIGWMLEDFSGQGFVNDDIKPASEIEYSIIRKAAVPLQPVSVPGGPVVSPSQTLATLTTSGVHDLIEGQEIEITDVDAVINGFRVIQSLPTSSSFTVVVDGVHTIASTAVTGISTFNIVSRSIDTTSLDITSKAVSNNTATLTTSAPHGLAVGDYVSIATVSNSVTFTATTTGNNTSPIVTVSNAANLKPGMLVTGTNIAPGTSVRSISGTSITLDKAPSGNVTGSISYTQDSTLNGTYQVSAVPSTTSFRYVVDTGDIATTSITGGKATYKSAVIATSAAHGLTSGRSIIISDVGIDYDGTQVVASVPGATIIKYNVFATLNQATEATYGATLKYGGRAVAATYGSFSANSDFVLEIDQSTTTDVIGADQQIFRGSDLRMFGEILEDFSKDLNGFEYRIDCDFQNGQFLKTFTFVPFVDPPVKVNVVNKQLTSNVATLTTEIGHGLVVGQEIVVEDVGVSFDGTVEVVSTPTSTTFTYLTYGYNNVPSTACAGYIGLVHPVSYLGADANVFEYPGNILDFSLSESAENAATRMWVGGNADGVDGSASQPYAAASATDLLGQGWPLLDQIEEKNDVNTVAAGEAALYNYAKDFLDESRPPEGSFTISVNGSFDPQIGDYLPGDWCTIIIDDDFVRARLASDLEPRSDIIVRKIAGIKVSVPDSPTFPEKVDLELVPEYREDRKNAK
jgi:hypothetical protein